MQTLFRKLYCIYWGKHETEGKQDLKRRFYHAVILSSFCFLSGVNHHKMRQPCLFHTFLKRQYYILRRGVAAILQQIETEPFKKPPVQ